LYPFDIQNIGEVNAIMKPPSFQHLLGTDELGRDILGYLISGSRVSMMVGLLATFISMLIGTVLGIVSGYYDKTMGVIIMRITDFFLVIPWLPLMIVLASIMGTSIWNIIFVIGITSWAGTARVVRSQTLSVKELQFIERAIAIGSNDSHIMKKHILPNVFPLVIANTVLNAAVAITTETTLSFLGLGDVTRPSWGIMLHYAFESGAMSVGAYWYFLPPGICIILVVLAFTFLGFAFDDIVNPKLKGR
jgi:peptide/nickel transport system permease protein